MKKIILLFIFHFSFFIFHGIAQPIPYGESMDSTYVYYEFDTVKYEIFYYKPLNYDTVNSPILFAIHGQGGNGYSEIPDLKAIADRRKALIVSPTMPGGWLFVHTWVVHLDSIPYCANNYWLTDFIKQIYRLTLFKENRDFVPLYLIGFSAGGQFVTRYMLVRQGYPDSIPIKMAVSTNAFFYTFCTKDSLYYYPCGLFGEIINYYGNCNPEADGIVDTIPLGFSCNEHVIQYYNENYGVLIGTADTTGASSTIPCIQAQGNNRYERAQNFYHFSDSDAVARGTTLKWQYGEVPGVGHNQNLMYNTILAGDSMPLAERLLFETPYHTVPSLAPLANFTADTTIVSLPSATIQFFNTSINATDYLWEFGDSTTGTDINPSHTYLYADTFTVSLTAISGTGCENKMIKKNYIIVTDPSEINKFYGSGFMFKVYPNPANETVNITYTLSENSETGFITIYNSMGRKIQSVPVQKNTETLVLNTSSFIDGLYFITLTINGEVKGKEKVLIIK